MYRLHSGLFSQSVPIPHQLGEINISSVPESLFPFPAHLVVMGQVQIYPATHWGAQSLRAGDLGFCSEGCPLNRAGTGGQEDRRCTTALVLLLGVFVSQRISIHVLICTF